ncbi:MAG: 50S ribosomal protein L3 N(5)-glutamine methyltransferase, partial [Gammaproteobacteria bacterium]|nr:50S ribosomal protein L3 N(5)-glutamine methyltransferase [Gammaproteobacteria bacterium]
DLFFGHGTDNPYDEAVFLVLRSLHLPFDVADEVLDKPLEPDKKKQIISVIHERITTKRPAAYILGEAWFAGLSFQINENALIPRSPFAELITEKFSPWCEDNKVKRILDIGTGCGCIAIASAFAFPEAKVDAIDISTKALEVAKKNVEHYKLDDKVSLIKSDLFQNISNSQYDLIIANPPYVGADELARLPAEYHYEPVIGLCAGDDGLDVVRRILKSAPEHLTEQGILAVEVGNSQQALISHFPDVPFLWLECERGGEGVFLLSRDQLIRCFS